MRCEECGAALDGVASGAPCPACGAVTPDARRLPPPATSILKLSIVYLWPLILVPIELMVSAMRHGGLRAWSNSAAPFAAIFFALLLTSLVFALNAGVQAWRQTQRLPRRQRSERVLLLPRPIAAAVGGVVFGFLAFQAVVVTLVVGGCLLVMSKAMAASNLKQDGEDASPAPAMQGDEGAAHADPAGDP